MLIELMLKGNKTMLTMRILVVICMAAFAEVKAQVGFTAGVGVPSGSCTTGITSYTDQSTGNYYDCVAGAWHLTTHNMGNMSTVTSTVGSQFPAGAIMLLISGTCPSGFSELVGMNGKFLLGTVAANSDVGTTGGSNTATPAGSVSAPSVTVNSITPSGTVSQPALTMNSYTPVGSVTAPVFSGIAMGTHSHELPFQLSSTTANRQIAAATFGTGTSRAATGASAAGSSNTTSAAVALTQSVSAGTPAGTNSAPSFTGNAATLTGVISQPTFTGNVVTPTASAGQPTFTGNPMNIIPAFIKVIFCSKN